MKITNKFKIIYAYIILFMLLLSTIIPYHKINYLDYTKNHDIYNPEYIIKYKNILFNSLPIFIIICIICFIIIHNNRIYKKKSNKKLIKPKWILINTIILCSNVFSMEIEKIKCVKTWCGPIGISNLTTTRFLGYYIYIISIILLFVYWIIIKKFNSNKHMKYIPKYKIHKKETDI